MYTNAQVALLAAVEYSKENSYYRREHALLALTETFKEKLDELDLTDDE